MKKYTRLTVVQQQIFSKLPHHLGIPQALPRETIHQSMIRILKNAQLTLTQKDVADICGCSRRVVRWAYIKYDIQTLPRSQWMNYKNFREHFHQSFIAKSPNHQKKIDPDAVRKQIYSFKSRKDIATYFDVSYNTIDTIMYNAKKQNPRWLEYSCKWCENKFTPKRINNLFCSVECKKNSQNYMRRFNKTPTHTRCQRFAGLPLIRINLSQYGDIKKCKECGNTFKVIAPSDIKRIFCSQKCGKRYRHRRDHLKKKAQLEAQTDILSP